MPLMTRAITLQDLPSPPPDKVGWPWIEQSEPLGDRMLDGSEYPRISIVTPSYNQEQFIEETIRSVLLQGYPNLEYIIIDGGSTDNTVEIIKKYEPFLAYWVSEGDRGQTDAIQKGFERITGVIWNWLNSDDLLEPNALREIATAYQKNSSATVFSGILTVFDSVSAFLHPPGFKALSEVICVWDSWNVPQPSMFLSSHACRAVSGLNLSLQYAMDYELYLRLANIPNFQTELLEIPIARIRRHPAAKTVSRALLCKQETLQVFDDFAFKHSALLPQGWQQSRSRFVYHLSLDSAGERVSLSTFLQTSILSLSVVWNYRFFWATLLSYFKPKRRPFVNSF